MENPFAIIAAAQHEAISLTSRVNVVRYTSAAAYIIFLCEYIQTIPEELALRRSARNSFVKVCFLLYRYTTLLGSTVITYTVAGLSGPLTLSFCRGGLVALYCLALFCVGIADAIVALRVSALWGRQSHVLMLLSVTFLATFVVGVVCSALGMTAIFRNMTALPVPLNTCGVTAKPQVLAGTWISGLIFDVIIFLLTVFNAFDRPRNCDKTPLTNALINDGIVFFSAIAALRFLNLVLVIRASDGFFLAGLCVAWPLSGAFLNRLVFKLHHVEMDVSEPLSPLSPSDPPFPLQDFDPQPSSFRRIRHPSQTNHRRSGKSRSSPNDSDDTIKEEDEVMVVGSYDWGGSTVHGGESAPSPGALKVADDPFEPYQR